MCRKKYEKRMNEFLYSVSFRVTFFSLPSFMNDYISTLAELNPEVNYREIAISQAEGQIIDIDSIALDLDIPIVNLLEQKSYLFENLIFGGVKGNVYVSPYYIYINIPLDENDVIGDTLGTDIERILSPKYLEKTQIQELECKVNHYLKVKPADFLKAGVLDTDAFPQLYPEEINTARFSDSHTSADGNNLKLIREISNGKDLDTDESLLAVNIISIAATKTANCNFNNLYEQALTESARCFKS